MKKVLITGAGSFIGVSFENYIKEHYSDKYETDTADMMNDSWKDMSFAPYDCVFHVAGIAHQKETEENAPLYYKVNRDLAIEVATKAKADGVGQFIFLSSMSVYGTDTGVITKSTVPAPKSNYGISKLLAEEEIAKLQDSGFRVCMLRPPMVYGKGCKGNFPTVVKLAKKSPVFPKLKNERSMVYIENLCEFVKMSMDKELQGVYFPQNKEYMNTCQMAKQIAAKLNKKLYMSVLAGLAVKCMMPFLSMARKAFGTLIYKDTEEFDFSYNVVKSEDSINRSL